MQLIRLDKYMGKVVEVIYMDRAGALSQRLIEIRSIRGPLIRAVCLKSGQPRTFRIDRILAVRPAGYKRPIHAS